MAKSSPATSRLTANPPARHSAATPLRQPADTPQDFILWDDEVPSLGLRNRLGMQSWLVQTRIGGCSVRRSLGVASSLTREAARLAASAVLDALRGESADMTDPATTVAKFGPRWLADCAGQWKPSTIAAHQKGMASRIFPSLGTKTVATLTADEVGDWFNGLTCAPGGRNRALAVLSGMMRHAEVIGLRAPGSNPCAGMRRKKSGFDACVLRPKDYARLGRTLATRTGAKPLLVELVRFLALTGCRRGEALALRWDWIDGNRAALPDAKAGPRAIWLGTPALELLASLPRTGDLVFGVDGKPLAISQVEKFWRGVRTELKMDRLRLHDLRHSYATTAISAGEALRTVGGLLGHSDLAITEGYTHLADDTLRAAAASVGSFLNKALGQRPTRQRKAPSPKPATRYDRHAIPASLIEAFGRSSLDVATFCAKHEVEEAVFRRALDAHRRLLQRGASK
ncbi:tyrosine-type recombinase/integrase [Paenirhodobacter populi]|nr:site-specific integrase [Sinirhodobacter populi]